MDSSDFREALLGILSMLGALMVLVVAVTALLNHKINRLARGDVHYHDGKTPCWKHCSFWSIWFLMSLVL